MSFRSSQAPLESPLGDALFRAICASLLLFAQTSPANKLLSLSRHEVYRDNQRDPAKSCPSVQLKIDSLQSLDGGLFPRPQPTNPPNTTQVMAATTEKALEQQHPATADMKPETPASAPAPDTTTNEKDGAATATVAQDQDAAAAACDFDPSADFKGDLQVSQDLPTEKDIKKCEDMLVLGADGESRPFKSLYSGEGVASRQLIIFVRHFFCGVRFRPLSCTAQHDD